MARQQMETNKLNGYATCLRGLRLKSFQDAARICMTHTFAYKDIQAIYGEWDCSPAEVAIIEDYLKKVDYDDYDLLIQLCDSLVLPVGFCILEKRFVETVFTRRSIKLKLLPYITIFPTCTLNLFTLAICFLDSSSFASIC